MIFYENENKQTEKAREAILIPYKTDFKTKAITRDKDSIIQFEYLSEETQNTTLKVHVHLHVHHSIIYNTKM